MDSIIAQLKDNYGKIVFAHEAHKQSSNILRFRLRCLDNVQIVLSVINAAAVIAILFKSTIYSLFTAVFSSLILLSFQLFFRKSDIAILAEQHTEAADHFEELRDAYLTLMTDVNDKKLTREKIEAERKLLTSHLLQHNNPTILESARKKVKKLLKTKKKCGFSEEETETLLPTYLKKSETGK